MKLYILNSEIIRYILNGLLATGVHYGILNFNIHIVGFQSYGIANFIAAIFGITCSFLGSRYFVYKGHTNSLKSQILRFGLLYTFLALLHGFVLYIWSDMYNLSYHIGFLLATFLQISLSYIGNKVLVFKNEN